MHRFDTAMPALTRKQINEQPERWHIHYAGVRGGLIQHRSGAPPSASGLLRGLPMHAPCRDQRGPLAPIRSGCPIWSLCSSAKRAAIAAPMSDRFV